MISNHRKAVFGLTTVVAIAFVLSLSAGASARTQLNQVSQFGEKVNQDGSSFCLATEACQAGTEGSEAGAFSFPNSVAVDEGTHDVYATDPNQSRVQKFDAKGNFLLMWGSKVNETTGADICTQAEIESSGVKCRAGEEGGSAGQIASPQSLAVDQATHNVYVLDFFNHRIDEYAPNGKFVLMFGGEVNKKGTNVCTSAETSECQGGVEGGGNGFFQAWTGRRFGGLLAAGGPSDLVYVSDQHRVQEFNGAGEVQGELSLVSFPFGEEFKVTGVSVDSIGDVYVSESWSPAANIGRSPLGVHEFDKNGTQIAEFDTSSGYVEAIAFDSSGRLTVIDNESQPSHGVLFRVDGTPISQFATGITTSGISYDNTTHILYVANAGEQDVVEFAPFVVPEPVTGGASEEKATSAALAGEVQANEESSNLTATSSFEFGRCSSPPTCSTSEYGQAVVTSPGEESSEAFVPVAASLTGLYPNQTYHYRLAARNSNGLSRGAEREFTTTPLPPLVESAPVATFVQGESAVLDGSLNPENAKTRYHFEYGACAPVTSCAHATVDLESAAYANVGVAQDIVGLLPSTTYHDRLVAVNEHAEATESPEGMFTTGPGVAVEALTGAASAITTTSAVISGAVNPDGQPAAYTFELGVYNGSATRYGVAFSGSAGAGTTPVQETLGLAGLQPGTTYAYRITVESGYGQATGATLLLTTAGVSSVLASPPSTSLLASPPIPFPRPLHEKSQLTNAQKLSRALKACRQKSKRQRSRCVRKARRRYAPKKRR